MTVLWVKRVTMELMGSREQRAIVVQQAQPGRPEARAIKAKAVLVERLASTVLLASRERREIVARRGRKARQDLQGLQGLLETRALKVIAAPVARLALRAATALAVTAVRRGRQGLQVTRVLKA